jgi:MoaA/NifB/PqqE/SkfB family radical SAM enzyme
MPSAQIDLSRVSMPRYIAVEWTSRCNLRCLYCQKSGKEWNAIPGRDQDLDEELLDRMLTGLKAYPAKQLEISGIGETTFRKDWLEILDRFRSAGMSIGIVTNFAKILSEAELDGMLTLKILTISLDTLDAELLRRVRHSVSLATIISNLVRLRVRARETGRELPYICLNAVIYYENMLDVIRLAHFAIENKIAQMQYTRMVNEAIAASPFPPFPHDIATSDPSRAREALRQLSRARTLLEENGIVASIYDDLVQTLTERAGLDGNALTTGGLE